MFHHKLITAVTVLSLSFCGNTAFAKTILFVPQDDRPVSFAYTVSTAEKAGYTVLTPRRLSFQVKVIKVSLKESGHGLIRILTRLMLPFYLLTP